MKKTREMIEKHLSFVDVVCEVCDARIPVASRNPIIDELTDNKQRILVLNKSDLADEDATKEWLSCFRSNKKGTRISAAVAINAKTGQGVNKLTSVFEKLEEEKSESGTNKAGIPLRLMIVGIPNSGKSSLINRLTGKKVALVGDRPGVTRGKQWLTLESGMQLLDTPGILWPKFEDPGVGLNLAFCGSIRDEIMDISDLGLELIRVLLDRYPDSLISRYGIDETPIEEDEEEYEQEDKEEALSVMEAIAKKRGFILQGARIDYERTARTVLDEFRAGKLGRITLEFPEKSE